MEQDSNIILEPQISKDNSNIILKPQISKDNSNIILKPQISKDNNNNIYPLFEPRFTTDENEEYYMVSLMNADSKERIVFIESAKKIPEDPRYSFLLKKTMKEWLESGKKNDVVVDMTPWIYYSLDDRYNMIKEYTEKYTENFQKPKSK